MIEEQSIEKERIQDILNVHLKAEPIARQIGLKGVLRNAGIVDTCAVGC
jgi:translation initiation factor 6 (eIF-6)